jgi:hypothetical protein
MDSSIYVVLGSFHSWTLDWMDRLMVDLLVDLDWSIQKGNLVARFEHHPFDL